MVGPLVVVVRAPASGQRLWYTSGTSRGASSSGDATGTGRLRIVGSTVPFVAGRTSSTLRMTDPDPQLLETVYDVLRVDLKLGDVALSADTPLVGEDLGLDSLDLLMVVTGTEKRLGIKIPNDRLGRDTMGTIGAFAIFVDEIRNQT